MFLKLTRDHYKVLINMDNVTESYESEGKTVLFFDNAEYAKVEESLDQIAAMLDVQADDTADRQIALLRTVLHTVVNTYRDVSDHQSVLNSLAFAKAIALAHRTLVGK